MTTNPVLLIIRDGWGLNGNAKKAKWDATRQIATPVTDFLEKSWPATHIQASGSFVGLPDGIMGNSEVGHQNIGAGRIVDQEIVRINRSIQSGQVAANPALVKACQWVRQNHSKLHLFGLLSSGGVHSMVHHVEGLVRAARQNGVERIYLHAFLDGRDTPPFSGLEILRRWEKFSDSVGAGQIASIMGRFWAMDRDRRWDRVKRAYDCLVGHRANRSRSPLEALQTHYDRPTSDSQRGDEFCPPTQIVDGQDHFVGQVEDGDAIIFFNFRGDRPREITQAFIGDDFSDFDRGKKLRLFYVTMTEYEKNLCPDVLFPKPPPMKNILGTYLSSLNLRQFRIAETEKYAHVTFFFNDYREAPFPGETRQLVPSPKDVSTYDQRPEMSADAVCEDLVRAIDSRSHDFLVVNFANPDMVGHTGNFEAAKVAIATVDRCIGQLLEAADRSNMRVLITSDHGNAEEMWDEENAAPHTQHTTNPVEALLYGANCQELRLREGCLADIAPTVLHLMGVPRPEEMTGNSLIYVP